MTDQFLKLGDAATRVLEKMRPARPGVETWQITDRAAWLSRRQKDVTASSIGALLGAHDYLTPYSLFALKSGLLAEDPEETPAMVRGRLLEPVAVDLLRELYPACAIAKRNAILGAVPKAVWRKAYQAVESVIAGDIKTLAERREKAMKAFAAFGVKPEQIFIALDVAGVEEIDLEHMATLMGMHSALKSGEATVEEMFPRRPVPSDRPKNLQEAMDKLASGAEDAPDAAAAAAADGAAAEEKTSDQPSAPEQATADATQAGDEAQSVPTTPGEYVAYARAWFGAVTDADPARARWTAEKKLRNGLNLDPDMRNTLKDALEAKIAALK